MTGIQYGSDGGDLFFCAFDAHLGIQVFDAHIASSTPATNRAARDRRSRNTVAEAASRFRFETSAKLDFLLSLRCIHK